MIPLLERVRAAVKAHNGEVLHESEEAIAFRGSGWQAEITMDLVSPAGPRARGTGL